MAGISEPPIARPEPIARGEGQVEPHGSAPSAALTARLERAAGGPVTVLAAEIAPVVAADLPVRGKAQKRAALPFALEERLGTPLEDTHCALGPATGGADRHLAAAVALQAMPSDSAVPVLSEVLAVPAPDDAGGPAWAVWAEGGRAVVRVSDGTGFAAATGALPMLHKAAGAPGVIRLAGPLPGALGADDRSGDPPAIAAADLAFDLRQGRFAPGGEGLARPLRLVASVAGLAILAHLGIAFADLQGLRGIAAAERALAQAALERHLPGVDVDAAGPAVLARLGGDRNVPQPSPFLTLLTRALAPLEPGQGVTVRRMGFDASGRALTLLVEAPDLDTLQRIEQTLAASGLGVRSGVATARAGAAEAELRITARGG